MITIYLITLLIFVISVLGLSLGLILNGRQIKGHCGGNPERVDIFSDEMADGLRRSCSRCDCQ